MNHMRHVTKMPKCLHRQQGFSLIELAVVLLVIGVVIGGASSLVAPYIEASRYKATQAKLEKIADALAIYAQTYYTIPCPGDVNPSSGPQGIPRGGVPHGGFPPGGDDAECGDTGRRGIVPYRVLGLTHDDIKDAYGNYITYVVSEILDQYRATLTDPSDKDFKVHLECMRPEWREGNYIWNMKKAKFCCPSRSGMSGNVSSYNAFMERILNVYDANSSLGITPKPLLPYRIGQCNHNSPWMEYDDYEYEWSDPAYTGDVPKCSTGDLNPTETVLFALISHGRQGQGAYRADGTTIPVTAGRQEAENATSVSRVVWRPISLKDGDSDYFDDIVLWRTNHQLMNAFGDNSCLKP